VDDSFNGVSLTGDVVDEVTLIGRGAGRYPTASAVLGDLVDCARRRGFDGQLTPAGPTPSLATPEQVTRAFYLRLHVEDRPGVLAEVANLTAQHDVSIATMTQRPTCADAEAALIFTTHPTTEAKMAAALKALGETQFLRGQPLLLRIADFG